RSVERVEAPGFVEQLEPDPTGVADDIDRHEARDIRHANARSIDVRFRIDLLDLRDVVLARRALPLERHRRQIPRQGTKGEARAVAVAARLRAFHTELA